MTFVSRSFVANFVSYISAKYYLNWFLFHIFIMEVIGVNFFWNTVYKETNRRRGHRLWLGVEWKFL